MFYDKLLDKKEFADRYFKALHDRNSLVIPPFTYSYILAHDSIKAVEKKGRTGFMMYPFKHFLIATYSEEHGFDNNEVIYAQPYSLEKAKNKRMNAQYILHRDYSLTHCATNVKKVDGVGRPVLFNKKELKTYINNKLVRNYNDCLFLNDGGQHYYLYEVDDVNLLIIWDDYYSSSINIIGMSQIMVKDIQHERFNHPYTALSVYVSALCSFFRMFPCGTLFNTTIERIRGINHFDNNVFLPLVPIACFDICTNIKDEIKEKVRIHDKREAKKVRNGIRNKVSKNKYDLEHETTFREYKRKVKRKRKRRRKKKRGRHLRTSLNPIYRKKKIIERRMKTGKQKKRRIRRTPQWILNKRKIEENS